MTNPPAPTKKLNSWSATDVGRKRDHNEDSFIADEDLGLFMVADGMGGHQGGDRASKMAVEALTAAVREAGDFEDAAGAILRDDPLGLALPRDVLGRRRW